MPIQVACPSCARQLRVPDELLGGLVKCPSCATTFTAVDPEPPRPAAAPTDSFRGDDEPPREPYPRRHERRRYGDDDRDDDRRRDRDWDDDDYPRRGGRSEARAQVAGPAIALMVVGILAVGLSLVSLVLNLVVGAAGPPPGNRMGPEEQIANAAGGVCGALFGVVWGGLILAGAMKMKNLESFGLAMTASIVAMLPCNGCCILGLPFGIWALVTLNRPEVKDAFT